MDVTGTVKEVLTYTGEIVRPSSRVNPQNPATHTLPTRETNVGRNLGVVLDQHIRFHISGASSFSPMSPLPLPTRVLFLDRTLFVATVCVKPPKSIRTSRLVLKLEFLPGVKRTVVS